MDQITGRTVLEFRVGQGLSQKRMAKRTGIPQPTISFWERKSLDRPLPEKAQIMVRQAMNTLGAPVEVLVQTLEES